MERQAELVTAAAWKAVEPREGVLQGQRLPVPPAFSRQPVSRNVANRQGVAQPGSALEWGSRSRQFKSDHPDHCLPLRLKRSPRLMPVLHLASASRIGFQKPREEAGGAQTTIVHVQRLGRGCSSL